MNAVDLYVSIEINVKNIMLTKNQASEGLNTKQHIQKLEPIAIEYLFMGIYIWNRDKNARLLLWGEWGSDENGL